MTFTASLADIITSNENGLLSVHPNWCRVPLLHVASILNGFPFPSAQFSKEGGVPLLRIRDVVSSQTETYYQGEYDPDYLVELGDLVVGMDGDFNSKVWNGPQALLNQRVCKISPEERFYRKKLLAYVLPGYLRAINSETSSVTVKHLSSFTVGEIPIPLPPLAEQDRLVAEIEKQFTRLEAAVAALKRVQANLKRYRAAVLKAACEGRLVPTEAELARAEGRSYEPADQLLQRILAERRARWEEEQIARMRAADKPPKDDEWKKKYQEPEPPQMAGLPELSEGWMWSSIGQVFDVYVGATPSRSKTEYWNGDISWVSSGEVAFCRIRETRERISNLGLENSSALVHPPGTVLLGMIGEGKTRGQSAILEIPACNNQNAAAIRVSVTPIPPEYIFRFFEGDYERTRRLSSGGNQPALNKERVKAIVFPLPPIAEQRRILTEVERRLSVIDELEMQVEANLKRAERLRQAILKHAFEGKLVPQDPGDEPASVLLERIRAERAVAQPLLAVQKKKREKRTGRSACATKD
jgi:type I restriction enzyme S subunit